MGAYATPPGDSDASAPASGMPGAHDAQTAIWNKELASLRSEERAIGLHRGNAARVFPHHFCTGSRNQQTACREGKKAAFSSALQRLTSVIDKYDDVHSHFRLDFRGVIAHCDLVQRNNVT
jgi:hypothetical protein